MAATALNTLKGWFVTAAKPLQAHYHAWLDSFWHKDEDIPINTIDGLTDALNSKTTMAAVEERLAPIAGSVDADFEIEFTDIGFLSDLIITGGASGSVTLRKNDDADTDFEIEFNAYVPLPFQLNMPVYAGAKLKFISPTTLIQYRIYKF